MTEKFDDLQKRLNSSISELDNSIRQAVMHSDYRELSINKPDEEERRSRMSSEVIITQDNFEAEVLRSDIPVLVDFWATWCRPCQMIEPTVSQIAQEYAGKIRVGKINIDEQPALAMQYGITAIPALVMFRGGEPTDRVIGLVPKKEIEELF